jgi:hypothetical protein
VIAPNARAAAQYYPADYWYSLINVPSKDNFPGTGQQGNGIAVTMKTQAARYVTSWGTKLRGRLSRLWGNSIHRFWHGTIAFRSGKMAAA